MTLKEKFKQWLDTQPRYQIREVQLEVIADEYALSFIDWYNTSETCERYLRRHYPKNITMDGSHYKKVLEVNKELLEIFKKEKGL
jgi:ribonucleotide reductase alpha subunit